MRRQPRLAFTLLEAVVTSAIFLGLVGLVFSVFDFGARSTATSDARAGLQTMVTRGMSLIMADLRRSSGASLTIIPRTFTLDGQPVRRDVICMAGVSDWSNPASFNTSFGVPNYDRFIVYYATGTLPYGKLIRSLMNDPVTPDGTAHPMAGFNPATHAQDDPALNSDQISASVAAENIRSLTVEPSSGDGVVVNLLAEVPTGPRPGGAAIKGRFQLENEIVPMNTWPKD